MFFKKITIFSGIICGIVLLSGCQLAPSAVPVPIILIHKLSHPNMLLASSVFKNRESIPARYTCDGENYNPPLAISGVPVESKSLVLIVDDPDAPVGIWTHWTVWNIPPTTQAISENVQSAGIQSMGAKEGKTSFGKPGWGGPCPPSGVHRYFFKLYALDKALDLNPESDVKEVEAALVGHILAETEMVGLYKRL